MPESNTCPCGREAVPGSHGPRLCASCDADHDAVLASLPPAGTERVVSFEFEMVDPAKGDLDGETFTVRDTDAVRAGVRASNRVAMLSKRLGIRLVKTSPTGMVRAKVGT